MRVRPIRWLLFALPLLVLALPSAHAQAACDPDKFSQALEKGWGWAYLAAFGWGFLTSLTPCVYPMIPIVVGIFGARDEAVTRRKAFLLATSYVGGMGLLFSALGVIFALVGKQGNTGTLLANPWVVFPVVGVYLLLASSMFGAFELNLPAGLQQRLNQVGGKGLGGAFALGMVGGLTAAPCTGPFLAGILIFVAKSHNAVAGSTLLLTYAIGMGILFWVLAVFAISLPKSGRWMEWVKSFGAIALLAAALYFLRPIIPALGALVATTPLFLVGALALTAVGLALGAVHLSFHDRGVVKARKAVAVLLTLAGLTGAINWMITPNRHLPWVHDEAAAFAAAKQQGKRVMIDFSATWCVPCHKFENTFASDGVYDQLMAGYVPLKFDVTKGTDQDDERQARYRAENLPAVIFLDADGKELGRVDTEMGPGDFAGVLTGLNKAVPPSKHCASATSAGTSGAG